MATSDDELLARAVAESERMLGDSGMGRTPAAAAEADNGDADSGGVPIPAGMLPLLKPHQVEGVRFMLRNTADNNGCVLAHSMGLGKTCQVVTLFAALLQSERAEGACRTALVLAPVSTLPNWQSEIQKWAKLGGMLPDAATTPSTGLPPVARVFAPQLDKGARQRQDDLATFKSWEKHGGILLMGYERYGTILTEKKAPRAEHQAALRFLRDPGPDLLICDEGHRLKTADGKVTQTLSRIATARRIILTGTPLQNNMTEYFTMLNFVRRDFYARSWFELFFRRPIECGQRFNALPEDVALMRARSYVLSKELAPFVLRKDQSILKASLPPKREYVVGVPLTEFQGVLYAAFARAYFAPENNVKRNLLGYVAATSKLSAHPSVFRRFLKWRRGEERGQEKEGWVDPVLRVCDERERATKKKNFRFCDSAKVQVLLYLLQGYVERREKVLVFTQSTETLDYVKGVLQELLGKMLDGKEKKKKGSSGWLYKLDGRNTLSERADAISGFQKKTGGFAVFLISTMAGGVGVNLNTAHGAVMFDVAYNPAHDQQAVFRCYRYGLKHSVSIYRLVSLDTPESTIYARCVSKEWVAKKVVDEASTTRAHITTTSLQELFKEEEQWAKNPTLPRGGSSGIAGHLADHYATERATCLARDPVLSHTASKLRQRGVELTQIYRHESLLVDDKEEEAGEEEQLEYQRYISSSEGHHNTLGSGRWGGAGGAGVDDDVCDPYGNDAEERCFAQAVQASAQSYRAELDERRRREKQDAAWEEELLRSGIGGLGGGVGGGGTGGVDGVGLGRPVMDDYTFLDGLGGPADDNDFWEAAVGKEEVEAIDVDGGSEGSLPAAVAEGNGDAVEAVSIADSERDSIFSFAEEADNAMVDDAAAEPVPVLPAESPPPEADAVPVAVPPAPAVDQPVSGRSAPPLPTEADPVQPPPPPPADDTVADTSSKPVPEPEPVPVPVPEPVPEQPGAGRAQRHWEEADNAMVDDAAAEPVPVLPAEPPPPGANAAPEPVPPAPAVDKVSPVPPAAAAAEPVVVKRKRGRPRKVPLPDLPVPEPVAVPVPVPVPVPVVAPAAEPAVVKRKRGRPRSVPVAEATQRSGGGAAAAVPAPDPPAPPAEPVVPAVPVKRGRGRPRKVPLTEAEMAQRAAAKAAAKQVLEEAAAAAAAAEAAEAEAAAGEGLSFSFRDTDEEEEDAVELTEEQQVALAIRRSKLVQPRKEKKGKKEKKDKKEKKEKRAARKRDRLARALEDDDEDDADQVTESPRKRRRTVAAFSEVDDDDDDDEEGVDSDSDPFERQYGVLGLTEDEQVALALAQSQEQTPRPDEGGVDAELQQALSLSLASFSRGAPGLGGEDDDEEDEGEDVEGSAPSRALPPLRPEDSHRSAFDVPPPTDKSRN